MPATEKALELFVHEGAKYGPIRSVLGVYAMDIPADGARVLEERKNNNWLASGVHPLAWMLAVGGDVAAVTTHGGRHGGGVSFEQHKHTRVDARLRARAKDCGRIIFDPSPEQSDTQQGNGTQQRDAWP